MEIRKYTKIEQFRNIIKQVSDTSRFEGLNDVGIPIFNDNPLPTITFTGTVKLHGTNAAVSYDPKTEQFWCGSRSRNITPEKDNAGFAYFADTNSERLIEIIKCFNNPNNEIVTLFGEWCGGNIQNGVALDQLEKMFVIFEVKIGDNYQPMNVLDYKDDRIYSIANFKTFMISIDFNNPKSYQNELIELTEAVENECPVAKAFDVSGIGEGIVWTAYYNDQRFCFKVKGEKHSVTKVKKLVSIDPEKLENIDKFVEYSVTENRLNQAIEQVFTVNNIELDIKRTGDFVNWIKNDILSEELDTLAANQLEPKDVVKLISTAARNWFMEKL